VVAGRRDRHSPQVGARCCRNHLPPGLRPDGTLPEDFSEEAAQAWRNVEEALALAGATLGDIVSVRQWLTVGASLSRRQDRYLLARFSHS
jgi:hypothetical protein